MIIQDDRFDTDSVTICPFTTDPADAPLFRLNIEATPFNGLQESCRQGSGQFEVTFWRRPLTAPCARP